MGAACRENCLLHRSAGFIIGRHREIRDSMGLIGRRGGKGSMSYDQPDPRVVLVLGEPRCKPSLVLLLKPATGNT